MLFSVGILYSSHIFLDEVAKGNIDDLSFVNMWRKYIVSDSKSIFETALKCEWITISNMKIELTKKGERIVSSYDVIEKLRIQLVDLLQYHKPSWAASIPYGRNEAFQFMPIEVKQCFIEANLIENFDHDTIMWWDKLASTVRGYFDDEKVKFGRIGEKLTYEYEKERTSWEPRWISVDTNLCGYDILSRVSLDDDTPLAIEVKTCSSIDKHFFISKNEWNACNLLKRYIFHIWIIDKHVEPELIIFEQDEMFKHVPSNNGDGEWESVQIHLNK